MSESEDQTEESGWTNENLQKLFAAMKRNIPKKNMMCAYTEGLKRVNWSKVAFPPFSAEVCKEKWEEILQEMRTVRSLSELIGEAEGSFSVPNKENSSAQHVEEQQPATEALKTRLRSPSKHKRPHKRKRVSADTTDDEQTADDQFPEFLPPKPPPNGYTLFCKEQLTSMTGPQIECVKLCGQRWKALSVIEKKKYNVRCLEMKAIYSTKLNQHLQTLNGEEEQQQFLKKYDLKRPKGLTDKTKAGNVVIRLPGEPKMPSRSGNVIYCRKMMELLKKKFPNTKERFTKANQGWQKLSATEKKSYQAEAQKNMREYSEQLKKWFESLTAAQQREYQQCNPSKNKFLNWQKNIASDRGQRKTSGRHREESSQAIPSDSEDEDLEDSSSDKEEEGLDYDEDGQKEEEEEYNITFDLY